MPSVSNHLDRLEASGLVTRRQAERDRRRVDLEVTPEGHAGAQGDPLKAHRMAVGAAEQAHGR